jgi:hypothetical protein
MDWSCAPFVRKGFISKQSTSTEDDQPAIRSYSDMPFSNENCPLHLPRFFSTRNKRAVLLTWSVRSGALGSGGSPPKMYEIGTLEGVLEIVLSGFSTISIFFGVESEVASNVLTIGL